MIRLFIALEIPWEIRKFIVEERTKISDMNLRWEPSDKLHLTLKFIGNFQEKLLDDLKEELKFVEDHSPFTVSITGYGFFYPRILWLGLSSNNNLFNLVSDLNKHLVKFKIPVEEKFFKPHLTLLRIPKGREKEIVESFRGKTILSKSFIADQVVLYKSELSPKGSKYTPLKIFKLNK